MGIFGVYGVMGVIFWPEFQRKLTFSLGSGRFPELLSVQIWMKLRFFGFKLTALNSGIHRGTNLEDWSTGWAAITVFVSVTTFLGWVPMFHGWIIWLFQPLWPKLCTHPRLNGTKSLPDITGKVLMGICGGYWVIGASFSAEFQ